MQPINERTSAKYTASLVDEASPPAAIPGSSLASLTLTLYDARTLGVINSRNGQNVLNANGVTVDEAGLLTWSMAADDNPIVATSVAAGSLERHVALFTWTWLNVTTRTGRHEAQIDVRAMAKVPA